MSNRLKTLSAVWSFAILFAVSSLFAAPAINSGSPAYLFPQSASYPHGLKPTSPYTASFTQDVTIMYNSWYGNYVTASGVTRSGHSTCTSCLRVQRNTNSNDTVSEGIGYGMLIAACMGDKTLFDGLYKYAQQWMPDSSGNYVMDWHLDNAGNLISPNGATDADQDMAFALLMASKQWGNGTTYNYQNEFQLMANAIWAHEIGGDGRVYPGDAFQSPFYTSYMSPAWYKCFNSSDTNGHNWTTPLNWVYNTFYAKELSLYPKGFKPDTTDANWTATGGTTQNVDASRWPLRCGLDYVWNGTAAALTNLNAFCGSINSCLSGGSANTCVLDTWDINSGTPGGSACSALQIGPAAVAFMSQTSSQSVLNTLYTTMYSRYGGCPGPQYFQDSLIMMSELATTGNWPNIVCGVNPCAPNTCTPTFTPTPAPCFMLDNLEDGNATNATDGFWYCYCDTSIPNPTSGQPSIVLTPTLAAGVGPTSLIVDGTKGANGTFYSAKVTGYWQQNGEGTPVTYAGFGLGTQLGAGYQNLSYMTQISFYVMASKACTLRLNFNNAAITMLNSGSRDNQYGYTLPAITTTNTWILETIPLSAIAAQDWGDAALPKDASVSVTKTQALSSCFAIEWLTQGPAITQASGGLSYWIDQVCITGATLPATATPLPTATSVVTVLPTATFTLSPTRTFTPTKTPTSTPSATPSPTVTPTKTSTPTNTIASTSTNTATPSQTMTPTKSFTPTFTASPTSTNTLANTATFSPTKTSTPSPTVTSTKTYTPTNTVANTSTNTATPSPTMTSTKTLTPTPTASATPTNTLANTATPSSTKTSTSTPTSVFSNTPTNSPTNTGTPTNTSTRTFTPTGTFTATSTSTKTFTFSPTITYTGIPGATSTNTLTVTETPTVTATPSHTATNTSTSTSTATQTYTSTSTRTSTASFTFTPTLVFTGTPTQTGTPTNSPQFTSTVTPTFTVTFSSTPTFTATNTFTLVNTSTPTPTSTKTPTPMNTPTSTSTKTPTPLNTSTPTFSPTMTSTPQPTVTFQQQASFSTINPGQTLTYTLTINETGSTTSGIVTDTLPNDVTFGTEVTGPTPSLSGNQLTWNLGTLPLGTTTLTFTVIVNNNAGNGEVLQNASSLSLGDGSVINANGSHVTVIVLTPTSTWTNTFTPTFTSTQTPTPTASGTSTFTPTSTQTPTPTFVSTVPVIFPNPVSGTTATIYVPGVNTNVTIQVFTTAFRLVVSSQPPMKTGNLYTLPLTDSTGQLLANGLYYVVVTAGTQRTVLKIIILH